MVYTITHKRLENYPVNCIMVGTQEADLPPTVIRTRDFYPDLAALNPLYGEVEAFKFIADFVTFEEKGQHTYRRQLKDTSIPEGYDGVAVPMINAGSLFNQYSACHNSQDLENSRDVLLSLYPEYEGAWHQYIMKGTELYYGGSFILKCQEYNDYATWLFSILDGLLNQYNFNTMEDVYAYASTWATTENVPYQSRFFGFLAERLTTLYFKRNLNIYPTNYNLLENGMVL